MRRRMLGAMGLFACAASAVVWAQRPGSAGPDAAPEVKVITRDYNMDLLLRSTQTPLSSDQRKGRIVWLQRCAHCHDGVGTPTYDTLGPYVDAEVVTKRGDTGVRDKIVKGSSTMPAFQWALKPAQIDQVIAFIKTIGPDQKPTETQKAGKRAQGADL